MIKTKKKLSISSGILLFILVFCVVSLIEGGRSRSPDLSQESLEFLHVASSGTIPLDDDEHYKSDLGYLSYRAYIYWNFSSSDPDVNIVVKAMTYSAYDDYVNTGSYGYRSISRDKNSDAGYFYPKGNYNIIVFENSHSYKSTTLTWEINVLYPTGIFSGNNPTIITIIVVSVVIGIIGVTIGLSGMLKNKYKTRYIASRTEY